MAEVVELNIEYKDCFIAVTTRQNKTKPYRLTWTDGIAVWTEKYVELSVLLCRLAQLIACGESDWVKGFGFPHYEARDLSERYLEQVLV